MKGKSKEDKCFLEDPHHLSRILVCNSTTHTNSVVGLHRPFLTPRFGAGSGRFRSNSRQSLKQKTAHASMLTSSGRNIYCKIETVFIAFVIYC